MATRYRSFAEGMQTLKAYVLRPEPDAPIAPVASNFPGPAANDNILDVKEPLDVEARIRTRPSLRAIKNAIKKCAEEGGPVYNERGQIIAIGPLRFSDGTQVEPAFRRTLDGGIKQYAARIPAGGMIGSSEKRERILGGDANPDEVANSNKFFAEAFGFDKEKVPPFRLPTKRPERKQNLTPKQTAADLVEAWANTDPNKVTYTRFPVGIARGGQRIGDSFIGMKVGRGNGTEGAPQWDDIYTAQVSRKIWRDSIAELSEKDRAVLKTAETAKTLRDIGGPGSKRAAERRGKRMLRAANDNLAKILQKNAA